MRSTSSEAAVQDRLNRGPKLDGYRINTISRGIDDTTVEAVALLNGGKQEAPLLLVLDDTGKLVAWKWIKPLPIEQSAINFVNDLMLNAGWRRGTNSTLTFRRRSIPRTSSASGASCHTLGVKSQAHWWQAGRRSATRW